VVGHLILIVVVHILIQHPNSTVTLTTPGHFNCLVQMHAPLLDGHFNCNLFTHEGGIDPFIFSVCLMWMTVILQYMNLSIKVDHL